MNIVCVPANARFPSLYRISDQPLYDCLTIEKGPIQAGYTFFNGNDDITVSNISAVGLPAYSGFKVKSLLLLPSLNTRYQDFKALMGKAHFKFVIGGTEILQGPAQLIISTDINKIYQAFENIAKGKSRNGKRMLEELQYILTKPNTGFELTYQPEILCLQSFKVYLIFKDAHELKQPVEICCILSGDKKRGITD